MHSKFDKIALKLPTHCGVKIPQTDSSSLFSPELKNFRQTVHLRSLQCRVWILTAVLDGTLKSPKLRLGSQVSAEMADVTYSSLGEHQSHWSSSAEWIRALSASKTCVAHVNSASVSLHVYEGGLWTAASSGRMPLLPAPQKKPFQTPCATAHWGRGAKCAGGKWLRYVQCALVEYWCFIWLQRSKHSDQKQTLTVWL